MAYIPSLMGHGMPAPLAAQVGMTPTAVIPAGTTQATATTLPVGVHLFTISTATSDAGVIFSTNTALANINIIVNGTGAAQATGVVYPPVGGKMNGATNGSLSLATGKTAIFIQTANTVWVSILTA